MPIYHCSASVISRSKGQSSCCSAAYRAGEKIRDERTGLTHDFTRKRGVLYSEIIAPAGSPQWATSRSDLWNRAELAEDKSTRRATATTAREFRVALPHELNLDEQIAVSRAFGQYLVDNYGVAVDYSIHAPDRKGDNRNFHVHILITDRRIIDARFADKVRVLTPHNGGRNHLNAIRKQWAEIVNQHLERAGIMERVDYRSYKSQGVERVPTMHLGAAANALERRGVKTELGNFNRAAAEINAIRTENKALSPDAVLQHEVESLEAAHIPQHATDEKDGVRTEKGTDEASSEDGNDLADLVGLATAQRSNATALSEQKNFDQQKTTETPIPSARKMTFEERIKEAEANAKIKIEQRRQLVRDHPSLGRSP